MTVLRCYIVAGFALCAIWPVWMYLCKSQEGMFTMFGLLGLGGRWLRRQLTLKKGRALIPFYFYLSFVFMAVYIVAYSWLPNLIRAALAFMSLGCLGLSTIPRSEGTRMNAVFILLPLLLPLNASLNFFFGFPLRRVTTAISGTALLPWSVTYQGTHLYHAQQVLDVGMPCSGINGLWVFLVGTAGYCVLYKCSLFKTVAFLCLAVLSAIFYNVLRICAIFIYRNTVGVEPYFIHQYMGLGAFAAALGVAVLVMHRIQRRRDANK